MEKDIILMVRNSGKVDVFLMDMRRPPQDPIEELKRFFPDRKYNEGIILTSKDGKEYRYIKDKWDQYNRSLQGIWYHPDYEYVQSLRTEARRWSGFLFDNIPDWCLAELEDTSFISL